MSKYGMFDIMMDFARRDATISNSHAVVVRIVLVALVLVQTRQASAANLPGLWETALSSNPTLMAASFAVEQAKATQDQALSKLLPNIGIKGQYSYNQRSTSTTGNLVFGSNYYPGYQSSLQISQVLFDLPSYLTYQATESVLAQGEQEALAARMKLASELVDNYLKVLEFQDVLEQLKSESEHMSSQLRKVRLQYEMHMSKVTDLLEIEAYGKKIETQTLTARNKKMLAEEGLRKIAGGPVDSLDVLAIEQFPKLQRKEDEWVEEALLHNPKLLALKFSVDAAQKKIASNQAEHLPSATLNASETYANLGYNNTQLYGSNSSYNVTTMGVQVNIPIYQGGGIEAGVSSAVAAFQVARERHEEQRRVVEHNARTAYLTAETNYAEIESGRQEVQFREKAVAAETRSHELGKATIVDVLEARRKLLQARLDQNRSRYDYIRNLILLRMEAGSLADLDIEAISPWFVPPSQRKPLAPAGESARPVNDAGGQRGDESS